MIQAYQRLPRMYEEVLKLYKVITFIGRDIFKPRSQKKLITELYKESLYLIQHLIDLFLHLNQEDSDGYWQDYMICLSRCFELTHLLSESLPRSDRAWILKVKSNLNKLGRVVIDYVEDDKAKPDDLLKPI